MVEAALRRRVFLTVLGAVAVYGSTPIAQESARDVLEKVKKEYDSIVDAQLKFSQHTHFEMTNIDQSVSGTLLLKKTNKYRVETSDQTIVTDGQTVWSYSAANKQVLIDHFKVDENSITPEKILGGAPTDFTSTFLGSEKIGRTETLELKLEPNNDQSMVKTMKLWVDNSTWLIKKAEILDVNGKQTEYVVTDIKTNVGLEDSRFTFQVPEGVEIVDLR